MQDRASISIRSVRSLSEPPAVPNSVCRAERLPPRGKRCTGSYPTEVRAAVSPSPSGAVCRVLVYLRKRRAYDGSSSLIPSVVSASTYRNQLISFRSA